MSNITPSPQSPLPNRQSTTLSARKRLGLFNIGKVFKSGLVLGLSIFSGYLIITEKPDAGFSGLGVAISILTMKDDEGEKIKELEQDNQQLQIDKEKLDLRYQFLENEQQSQLQWNKERHELQLQLAVKDYQILMLNDRQNKNLELTSQISSLPEGQATQFYAQQNIPQKQITSEDLES